MKISGYVNHYNAIKKMKKYYKCDVCGETIMGIIVYLRATCECGNDRVNFNEMCKVCGRAYRTLRTCEKCCEIESNKLGR